MTPKKTFIHLVITYSCYLDCDENSSSVSVHAESISSNKPVLCNKDTVLHSRIKHVVPCTVRTHARPLIPHGNRRTTVLLASIHTTVSNRNTKTPKGIRVCVYKTLTWMVLCALYVWLLYASCFWHGRSTKHLLSMFRKREIHNIYIMGWHSFLN